MRLLTLATLALLAGAVPVTAQETDRELEAVIMAAMTRSADDWNRADLDGHMNLYTDTSTMMGRNGPQMGKPRIQQMLSGFWRDGKPIQQLSFSEIVIRRMGPGYALVTGKFELTGGDRPVQSGRYSLVWARTREGWRILHDHSS